MSDDFKGQDRVMSRAGSVSYSAYNIIPMGRRLNGES